MTITESTPILFVEDVKMMQQVISRMLASLGYRDVTSAASGEEAVAHLRQRAFGLIISDWNLDKLSGLDLLAFVRASTEHASTPFIMISGHFDRSRIAQAIDAGANAMLIKPFTINSLSEKLAICHAFKSGRRLSIID